MELRAARMPPTGAHQGEPKRSGNPERIRHVRPAPVAELAVRVAAPAVAVVEFLRNAASVLCAGGERPEHDAACHRDWRIVVDIRAVTELPEIVAAPAVRFAFRGE